MAKAEFDSLAETYYEEHKKNIKITGEDPEYFAEYKIVDLADWCKKNSISSYNIADFGCGIGNSIPHFRKYFPAATLSCMDVSEQSLQLARKRFPGNENRLLIENEKIPLPEASQDLVFSACVFHHISPEEHHHWFSELVRVTRPGGILAIYEHNPLNPLTAHAFNTCPLDENACMIPSHQLRRKCAVAGWKNPSISYKLFFPGFLSKLRPLEKKMGWLFLGAQYRLLAVRS
jgi:SAM-dependent methyltransferase